MMPLLLATFGFGSAELLVMLLVVGLFFIVPLALIPAILAYVLLDRIPPAHRKQTPALALLLLIPLFSLIWAFFVYPRISESLQSYFASKGEDHGDCGRSIALAACICGVCGIVPFLGMMTGVAALVLLILFFVKGFELTGKINHPVLPTSVPPVTPLPSA